MKEIKIIDEEVKITSTDIEELENTFKFNLPKDYKEFLLLHNGGHPVADCYDLLESGCTKSSDLAWFYAIYDGEYENLAKELKLFKGQNRIPKELIPIARDSGSNQICLCIFGTNYGKVYYWDHNGESEDGKEPTYENVYLIANSFTDFVNSLYEYKE